MRLSKVIQAPPDLLIIIRNDVKQQYEAHEVVAFGVYNTEGEPTAQRAFVAPITVEDVERDGGKLFIPAKVRTGFLALVSGDEEGVKICNEDRERRQRQTYKALNFAKLYGGTPVSKIRDTIPARPPFILRMHGAPEDNPDNIMSPLHGHFHQPPDQHASDPRPVHWVKSNATATACGVPWFRGIIGTGTTRDVTCPTCKRFVPRFKAKPAKTKKKAVRK